MHCTDVCDSQWFTVGRQSFYVFSGSKLCLEHRCYPVITNCPGNVMSSSHSCIFSYKKSLNVEMRSAWPEKAGNTKISSPHCSKISLLKHWMTTASAGTSKQWRMVLNSTSVLLHSKNFNVQRWNAIYI